ncbi:MAG: hypothetical protein KGL26_00850 [Pseudomonadota bacterium]|nr:hypothetical protein [Pseudomonadota bacterium]
MSRISYDTAETLVYDPVGANRNATRSALYALGFRRIETVATLEAFNEFIVRRPPDLAVCEAMGAEDHLCHTIQSLRHGLNAYNPFIVIVVTAWENHHSLVNRVLDSGADDLLLRPFSTTTLEARIRTHIERRKGFVITSDYIGPDRRRDRSRPSNVDLFHPPNSLKMKVKERLSAEEAAQRIDSELKTARETLTTEKLRRDAFQICILWRLVQERQPKGGKAERADLARLGEYSKAISRRCRDTEFEGAVEWCDALHSALEGLELGVDYNASMHLLGHAALSLGQVFSPDKTMDENLAEIDATIERIKARNKLSAAS